MVAELDVVRDGDLDRHVAVRIGPEEIGLQLAEQLDLTDLLGGHVRRRHCYPATLHRAIGVDVERRRVGDASAEAQQKDKHHRRGRAGDPAPPM